MDLVHVSWLYLWLNYIMEYELIVGACAQILRSWQRLTSSSGNLRSETTFRRDGDLRFNRRHYR